MTRTHSCVNAMHVRHDLCWLIKVFMPTRAKELHYFVSLLHNNQAGDTNYQDVRRENSCDGFFLSIFKPRKIWLCANYSMTSLKCCFYVGLLQAN